MDDPTYRASIGHLRRIAEALRLLDLDELSAEAEKIGTDDDCRLIAALRTITDKLPDGRH